MPDKFQFNYDKKSDILLIYHSQKKSKGSIEYGKDLHISFSHKGEVVALEVLDASETLSKIVNGKITKNWLANLVRCNLKTEVVKGLMLIKFYLFAKEKTVSDQIVLQDIKYRSPATALAR